MSTTWHTVRADCNLPGAVCEDPRFIGGEGNTFYFHGRRDRDFCLLSDADLHINAHFIGSHVPGAGRDPTWVQAIAVQFSGHRLYVGARRTAAWDDEADRLAIVFDGAPVEVQGVANARWEAPSSPLSVTRTKAANGVVVELVGTTGSATATASRTWTWRSGSTRSPTTCTACWGRPTGAAT